MQRTDINKTQDAKDRKILSEGINDILKRNAPLKGKVILFGSRARGTARSDSDWDILILLDKDRITPSDIDNVSYPVRELGWNIGEMINPIMFTEKEWEMKSFTPFYKNVMKEGILL